jgi:hypothetical protein
MDRASAITLTSLVVLAVLLTVPPRALAAWPHDTDINLPVATTTGTSQSIAGGTEAVSDGAGGVIAFWNDRTAVDNIRAQRIDADGNRLWGPGGALVLTGTLAGQTYRMAAVSDGSGGAIVAWSDPRGADLDVFVQRVNASGTVQWSAGGVALCTAAGDQTEVRLAADGAGGAWVVWTDARAGAATDIYARRVSSTGVPQGAANGVAVCTAAGAQSAPRVHAAGAAYVVWVDPRGGTEDIYAQRLDGTGTPAWAANGVGVCTAAGIQIEPEVTGDGSSGFVVTWMDSRAGATFDVYAQRVLSGGTGSWTANGVLVSSSTGSQSEPSAAHDGAGGVVIAYTDLRFGSSDISAQRLSIETGAPVWGGDGVPLCAVLGRQIAPQVVADGTGGAYVGWVDLRLNDSGDIYAQRVSSGGVPSWGSEGIGVAVSLRGEGRFTLAAGSPDGCLFQVGQDSLGLERVAAQKVDRWGYLGGEPTLVSVTDVPNDQGGRVKVSWLASPLDSDPLLGVVSDYLVLRSVPTGAALEALAAGRATEQEGDGASPAEDGRRRLIRTVSPAGVTSFWESVSSQLALRLPAYSAVVPTTGDSVAGSNPTTDFMVQARNVGGAWWNSGVLAGYSVDDLAPATPAPFNGVFAAGTTLMTWGASSASDLAHYRLYRGPFGFVPSPANLVASPTATTYGDPAGAPYVYQLTAVDVHGNESAPAVLIPDGTLAADPGAPARDFLATPAPQPLRSGAVARLRFGLARAGHVRLAVVDLQGRRIATVIDAGLAAGEHAAEVPGGSTRLAPGHYVVRMTAPGFEASRRLIVMR